MNTILTQPFRLLAKALLVLAVLSLAACSCQRAAFGDRCRCSVQSG
jgi:hypothetical protein